jgi:uncharacterized membrane protein YesL
VRFGRVHRVLEVFTNHVSLSLLWLLGCLPVVTIPASTAAVFAVTRRWADGDEPRLLREFGSAFRRLFWRSSLVGALWLAAGAVLFLDFVIIGHMEAGARRPLWVLLAAFGVIYALTSANVGPALAGGDVEWRRMVANAALVAAAQPLPTAASTLVLLSAATLVWVFPPVLLVLPSATAYVVTRLHVRAVRNLLAREPRRTSWSSGQRVSG